MRRGRLPFACTGRGRPDQGRSAEPGTGAPKLIPKVLIAQDVPWCVSEADFVSSATKMRAEPDTRPAAVSSLHRPAFSNCHKSACRPVVSEGCARSPVRSSSIDPFSSTNGIWTEFSRPCPEMLGASSKSLESLGCHGDAGTEPALCRARWPMPGQRKPVMIKTAEMQRLHQVLCPV